MATQTDIIAVIMTTSTQYYPVRAWDHISVMFSIEKGLDPWCTYLDDTQLKVYGVAMKFPVLFYCVT
jgi:predicted metalloenzyme YecM